MIIVTPTSFWSSGAYDIYYEVKEYYNQGIYEVWYWEDNYESFYVPVKIYSTPVSEELMDP